MRKNKFSLDLYLLIWAAILVIAVALTLNNTSSDLCRLYDEKIEAAILAQEAMCAIKDYKAELNIPISNDDINQTGMLGEQFTPITTTLGLLESKRTSLNPQFASVIIDMFKEIGLKKGSEIAVVFSGSFPAINISVLAAIEVFELKPCIMASIGASSYGANNPKLTFYDMAEHLYEKGYFSNRIDYVSFGGSNDTGEEFTPEVKEEIRARVIARGTRFIYEENFHENVEKRMEYIWDKLSQPKLLINVGGNLVAMGNEEASFIHHNGLVKPNYLKHRNVKQSENIGLLDQFLQLGLPVIHMLNLKSLSYQYGLGYDPQPIPEIGVGNVYMETEYKILIPIITIIISLFLLVFYYYLIHKDIKKRGIYERKNIFCRR